MRGQPHALADLLPGKEHPVPIEQGAMSAPEPVWMLWRREKYLALAGIRTQFLSCPVHSMVAILTELHWLKINKQYLDK